MQILPGIVASRAATPVATAGTTGGYFDGTNDYLFRSGGASVTTNQCTWSFWINHDTLGTVAPTFDYLHRIRDVSGLNSQVNFPFFPINGGAEAAFIINWSVSGTWQFNNPGIVAGQWSHILISIDLSTVTPVVQVYVDDVFPAYVENAAWTSPATLEVGSIDHWIGREIDGSRQFNGSISEFYFSTEHIDLSVEANRRKFISATGKPVSLGSDGSLPTGNQPFIYFRDPFNSFETNHGNGGSFSKVGALGIPSTYPAD